MMLTKIQYNLHDMFTKNLNLKSIYLLLILAVGISSCNTEEALLGVDAPMAVSFDKSAVRLEVEETTTYDVIVSTLKASTTEIVVDLEVKTADSITSADLYSMTPSVTIPAGQLSGSSTLSFSHDLLDFGDEKELEIAIADSSRKGGVILNEERTSTNITFVKKCTLNDVVVSITTDDYPEETLFRIFDLTTNSSGDILFQSKTLAGQANTTVSKQFCLNPGKYAIVVYDLYGDGIVGGGFTVSVNGAEAVALTSVTGASAVALFDIM